MSFPRLYAILDAGAVHARGLEPLLVLDAWLDAGVRLVQLRAKALPGAAFLALARHVVTRAHDAGAIVLVNDRADIARASGADGVHLGQEDLTPFDVRPLLGPPAWIGLSTHSRTQAEAGATSGASYLAIGPVFATQTKGALVDPVVGLAGVWSAADVAGGLPVVAIGGITAATAGAVLAAGAASVAVIGDLLAGDPAARVSAFRDALGGL